MNSIAQTRSFATRATVVFAVLSSILLFPGDASAQLGGLIVRVTSPAAGSTVGGTIDVTASVNNGGFTQGVQFQLDGANLGAEDTSAPYSIPWNTRTATNGSYTLRAVARDTLGIRFNSDPVTVTVFNDTTPPTVSITSPVSGSNVTGTVNVAANATDNVGVVGVEFRLNGTPLGAEDTTAPYSTAWDTSTAAQGATYTLTAIARDAAGNSTTSAAVTVSILDNTPPTVAITSPASGSNVSGTITVSANATDNVGVLAVQFRLDGAELGAEDITSPYSTTWNTSTAAPGSHTLTAVARDAAGNSTTSSVVTVNVPDITAPTVSISSPTSGSTVSGTTTVSANATDNVGVVGVQFRLDGAALGAEDTTSPYSTAWDTSTALPGSHTLTAVARDAAGNSTTSSAVTVNIADTTAPAVSISSPTSGSNVSGTISVSANASDNVGVAGVQFRLDGAVLGAEDTASPYSTTWNTSTAAPGSHTLTAVARDAAGNSTTSSSVTVNVADTTAPTVSISSPTSGSTVSGTTTVSANASDNVGVVGVQFRLDGGALGAEDTTTPYSTTWDTSTAAPGSHTLTAVARDAAGNSTTSSSVTVNIADTTAPTVSITSPTSGSTVSGTTTVTSNASDNVGVAGVQLLLDGAALGSEDTASPYSTAWDTTTATNGNHTLSAVARDAAGNTTTSASVIVNVSNVVPVPSGDIFVGYLDGRVQQHAPDGTLKKILLGVSDGEASGIAFDSAGLLYVPHWYSRTIPFNGNTIARFDQNGDLMGTWGTGYDCNPSSIDWDAAGNAYVGHADCSGDILKLSPAGVPLATYNAQIGNRGADHIDLAPDGCTMVYAVWTQDVLRYNVCTSTQLPKLNTQPLPGDAAFHLRILPDGGVLVADSQYVVRLDAAGNQVMTYFSPGGGDWFVGLDLLGDGTFYAVSHSTNDIVRFNIATGAIVSRFNAGGPPWTAVGVAVKP